MSAVTFDTLGPHDRSGARTSGSLATSLVLHALALLYFILAHPATQTIGALTEISFEPEDSGAAAPAAVAQATAAEAEAGVVTPQNETVHFKRALARAEVAPAPQLERATEDRLNARLVALQGETHAPAVSVVSAAPATLWGTHVAAVAGAGGDGGSPIALQRGGPGVGAGLALTRGAGAGHGLAPALAPTSAPVEAEPEPAKGGETVARRTLAGTTLMGPIADRPVLSHTLPVYPEWAKREAVEGSVTLYFIVRTDGTVRENVLVQKTAGFGDFDDNARAALRAWRFEPLHDGRTGDQWGTITFHFRLREGD